MVYMLPWLSLLKNPCCWDYLIIKLKFIFFSFKLFLLLITLACLLMFVSLLSKHLAVPVAAMFSLVVVAGLFQQGFSVFGCCQFRRLAFVSLVFHFQLVVSLK